MIRLIVSDIDGTLLPEGETCLNPEYMNVIRELNTLGVKFAAASGRQASSMDVVFHEVNDIVYYVAGNGASVEQSGKILRETFLDADDVKAFLECAAQIPECSALIAAKGGYFFEDDDPVLSDLVFEQFKASGAVVEDMTKYADVCNKLNLYQENGAHRLYKMLHEEWEDRFFICSSSEHWLEICNLNASKGNAVQWLQEQLGITPEETIVFGDNFNDIPMMKRAGRSYASELSHPDVKKEAKYEVASYAIDGVLHVLKQLLEEIRNETK